MPLPKITGLLNNCALNTALPIILEGISDLATYETAEILAEISDNEIFESYLRLKEIYAEHYLIGSSIDFNWLKFSDFIRKNSFYANELMFAPVLRKFIAEKGFISGNYRDGVSLLKDVQHNGRYNLLPDTEAIDLLHNHFGISVETYEFEASRVTGNPKDNYNNVRNKPTTNDEYPFGQSNPTIQIYLKDAHFELQPHELLAVPTREFDAEIAALPRALYDIHHGLSCSTDANTTNHYLRRLIPYVRQAIMIRLAPSYRELDSGRAYAASLVSQSPADDGEFVMVGGVDVISNAETGSDGEFTSLPSLGINQYAACLADALVPKQIAPVDLCESFTPSITTPQAAICGNGATGAEAEEDEQISRAMSRFF